MNVKSALIAVGCDAEMADTLQVPFRQLLRGWFGLTTPRQMSLFLANAAHESASFTRTSENLWYTTEAALLRAFGQRLKGRTDLLKNPEGLANVAYASRLGNGDEASGDGWKYRGRGYFQLTGRSNYTQAARALSNRFDAHPELVSDPEGAVLTAAWFWSSRGIAPLAEAWNTDAVRERINGPAKLGADEVAKKAARALRALESE